MLRLHAGGLPYAMTGDEGGSRTCEIYAWTGPFISEALSRASVLHGTHVRLKLFLVGE